MSYMLVPIVILYTKIISKHICSSFIARRLYNYTLHAYLRMKYVDNYTLHAYLRMIRSNNVIITTIITSF